MCNRCGTEITWKKPFSPGDRPLNQDKSVHICVKPDESPKTSNSVLEECIVFEKQFKDQDAAKFESLAKIYISGRMRR